MSQVYFSNSERIESAKEQLIKLNETSLRHSWTDEDEKEYNKLCETLKCGKGD